MINYKIDDSVYSATDFSLSSNIVFPNTSLIGFNITCVEGTKYPLYLHTIKHKIFDTYNLYTFIFKDTNNIDTAMVNIKISNNSTSYADIITIPIQSMFGIYIGCLVVTNKFYEWLNTLPITTIECNSAALVLNPIHCRLCANYADYRITVNGDKVENIELGSDLSIVDMGDKKWSIVNQSSGIDDNYAELPYIDHITFFAGPADNRQTETLSGKHLLLSLVKGKHLTNYPDYTTIKYDGHCLYITDEKKWEELS